MKSSVPVVLTILMALATTMAIADTDQTAPEAAGESLISAISVAKVYPSQKIRLKVCGPDSRWLTATYVGQQDDDILLKNRSGKTITMAAEEVCDFQVSTGRQSRLAQGGIVGAGLGAMIAMTVTLIRASETPNGTGDEAVFSNGLKGAFSGALLGIAISSGSSSERYTDLDEYNKPGPAAAPEDEIKFGLSMAF